ncbi:flagellar hook-basal body complex protein [Pectinatus frisingensis]|uniref:flagellar hook-basal body complex protein n=1 Tax=Pectinatus frisingensis TaxID=865 RepID=UPI0018C744AD|nr:flagellar hook-basal body complex protein [Pectinatus frisingensis]
MMRSLFTAVSGLKNHQTRMDVIGNNIANVNTTGYKSSRVTFADTLSQTLSGASSSNGNVGGVDAKQVGLGMSVSSIDTNFTHGSASSTGNNTDMAIDTDNGLFVVKDGDNTYYTRNGNFTLDDDGSLVMNGSGLHLQGWNATDGSVNPSGDTQNLKINMNSTMQPKPTSTVASSGNLSADDKSETIKNIKLTLADGTTVSVPSTDTSTAYHIGDTVDKNKVVLINATLADGSTVPLTSGGPFKAGGYPPSNQFGNVSGIDLTFADGSTATGVSGFTYKTGYSPIINKITLKFSDNSTVDESSGSYKVGDTVGGKTILSMTATDGTTTFTIPSSSTSTYTVGIAYPSTVSTMAVTYYNSGNSGATTKTSALTTSQIDSSGYTIGNPYQSKITGIIPTTLGGTTAPTADTDPAHLYTIDSSDYPYGTPDNSTISGMTLTLSDGTNSTTSSGVYGSSYTLGGSTYPSYATTATVYDSLGAAHSVPVSFQRTSGTGDTWLASVAPGTYGTLTIPSGVTQTLTFDGSTGKLTSGGSMTVGMTVPYPNGATQNQQISIDFSNLTQYSGENNASATGDGYAAGFYKDMSIGQDGVITISYTNGQKQTGGQIAIASFNNPAGLEKEGGSLYSQSNNSGTARVGTFTAQGVTVTPGALEMSNVDISNEFSDMIVTQRGFQANSKIITVSDEMLQTLINMKQS